MPIESIDELEDGETYHYIKDDDADVPSKVHTFTVDLEHMDADDFAGYDEGAIQLQYSDGYTADVPTSNIERHIDEGRIGRGEA